MWTYWKWRLMLCGLMVSGYNILVCFYPPFPLVFFSNNTITFSKPLTLCLISLRRVYYGRAELLLAVCYHERLWAKVCHTWSSVHRSGEAWQCLGVLCACNYRWSLLCCLYDSIDNAHKLGEEARRAEERANPSLSFPDAGWYPPPRTRRL